MRVLFALFAFGYLTSFGASGQTYYKCPQKGGGFAYTDVACPSTGVKILEVTPAQAAIAKLENQTAAMDRMIKDPNVSPYEVLARAHAQGLDSLLQQRLQIYNAQVNSRRAAYQSTVERDRYDQQAGMAASNARLRAQNAQLSSQNERLQTDSGNDVQAAQQRADADTQMRNMTPRFNPATGQWCTTNGGFVQCH